jgi:hypothetical protein
MKDIQRWIADGEIPDAVRYGESHSCYPYYAAFLPPTYAAGVCECRIGSAMTPGQAKRINRECGFTRSHKKNLWYCPECVREDFTARGETCWRRAPQMPGVAYCPVHGVKLRESGVSYKEINYQIIPATYAVIHLEEPDAEPGNVYKDRYIRLSKDIAWLLDNGLSLKDNEWVRRTYNAATGKYIGTHLFCSVSYGAVRGSRFEDYLAGRILNECGKKKIDSVTGGQIGMILSIEEAFGSMEEFSKL